ncbi:MAG TPA: S9 family peptidase [Haliangium sp.]|nr:S9 family peptidase [Haliangium sp.]
MLPAAAKKPRVSIVHGEPHVDDYAWLRERDSAEVLDHLRAENVYTAQMTAPLVGLYERIHQEIVARMHASDQSVPVLDRGYYYYTRTEAGRQYALHCRRRRSLDAEEQILLDLDALAVGAGYLELDVFAVSDDGQRLAYSVDTTGAREYTLRVLDLRTGAHGPERIAHVRGAAWADDRTLLYTVHDPAKRPYRLYRHFLGASGADDELLYEESDARFQLYVWRARSRDVLFVVSASFTTTEVRFLPAGDPAGRLRLMAAREPGHAYHPEHAGDRFYLRTNDRGPNFRVVSVPVSAPDRGRWQEVVPHRSEVMLSNLDVFRRFYVLTEREHGLPHLRVGYFDHRDSHRVTMPDPAYAIARHPNPETDTDVFLFTYQSLTTPDTVYAYDAERRELTMRKQTRVLGGYDPAHYRSERIHATAADGTLVPISLVYRKDVPRDGSRPLLLHGYGAYGFSYPLAYHHARVSLLDRGMVVAIAHVRGGGELGKPWHDSGRMLSKISSFTDYIAAAEHLIAHGYANRERLAGSGGSAGGLLLSASINMRPGLFRVALSHVPFVDVLNTMLDESLPLTVPEFEEWGDPRHPEHYAYIKRYCPYTNVRPQPYPAMLVTASFHDSQVMYWEPAKYVAKLREHNTASEPILLRVDMEGGHSGPSGRYDRMREIAFAYAFLLDRLGVSG